jgi:hypothetical protein
MSDGSVRRAKVPPFQRDAIDLGRHGRTWQTLVAEDLRVGDIIRDRGLVESIEDRSEVEEIDVKLVMGDCITYKLTDNVVAFSKKTVLTDETD